MGEVLTLERRIRAYCWSSGLIEFQPASHALPARALPITVGPESEVREFLQAVARHAYDGETLLVPGVPEAESESAKLRALIAWRQWLVSRGAPLVDEDGLQRCRSCGCSEVAACAMADGGGCWWVAPDLCSACASGPEER